MNQDQPVAEVTIRLDSWHELAVPRIAWVINRGTDGGTPNGDRKLFFEKVIAACREQIIKYDHLP